jgi:hypothetical protein
MLNPKNAVKRNALVTTRTRAVTPSGVPAQASSEDWQEF